MLFFFKKKTSQQQLTSQSILEKKDMIKFSKEYEFFFLWLKKIHVF